MATTRYELPLNGRHIDLVPSENFAQVAEDAQFIGHFARAVKGRFLCGVTTIPMGGEVPPDQMFTDAEAYAIFRPKRIR